MYSPHHEKRTRRRFGGTADFVAPGERGKLRLRHYSRNQDALRGQLQWTDGMLYPVLHRMERNGLIKSRWAKAENGRKRKYYSIKEDGKKAHKQHHEHWTLIHTVLASLRKEQHV